MEEGDEAMIFAKGRGRAWSPWGCVFTGFEIGIKIGRRRKNHMRHGVWVNIGASLIC